MSSEPTPEAMRLLDNDEVNRAAISFKTGVVKSKRLIGSMPKKSMSRVYNAIVEFPLGDAYPKFRDKKEQELFNLTLELLAAKNVMVHAVVEYQDSMRKGAPDGLSGTEEVEQASGVSETIANTEA